MRLFAVGVEPVGVIALGAAPTGIVAVGQLATGVVAIGQGARGVVAVGQLAVGALTFGQLSVGALWAGGQLAIGATSGVAMLPIGLFGRWNPFGKNKPTISVGGSAAWLAIRILVFCAVLALVLFVTIGPIVDAIVREGGIFVDPPPEPRILR